MAVLWWRSWHDAPIDHKWPVIAARAGVKTGVVSAIAWALLDYASQNTPRGSVEGFDAETYAVYSGFSEDEILAVIKAMKDKRVIVDGVFFNWDKRQPKREDDNSTERVRKHREMKRNETQGNDEQRPREQRTDTDTDTERESAPISFDLVQSWIEQVTGLPASGESSTAAINKLLAEGVTQEDIMAGAEWLRGQGKSLRYFSSIVGPAITAKSKRVQAVLPAKPRGKVVKTMHNVHGDKIMVYEDGSEERIPCPTN